MKRAAFEPRRGRRRHAGHSSALLLMHVTLGVFATGLFLYNTQLNRAYVGWDIVQDAGYLAADAATKILCASPAAFAGSAMGETSGPRGEAIFQAIEARLSLVANNPREQCKLDFEPAFATPGAPLEMRLECDLTCPIPIAGRLTCPGGRLAVNAKHTIQPGGCDRR